MNRLRVCEADERYPATDRPDVDLKPVRARQPWAGHQGRFTVAVQVHALPAMTLGLGATGSSPNRGGKIPSAAQQQPGQASIKLDCSVLRPSSQRAHAERGKTRARAATRPKEGYRQHAGARCAQCRFLGPVDGVLSREVVDG